VAWSQVHHHYRYRFGIEASYRVKNHARIRSTTKNPALRLLYVALAFILVNLWIYSSQSLDLPALGEGECDSMRWAAGLSRALSAQ